MLDLNSVLESKENCLSDFAFWNFLNGVLLKDQYQFETVNDFLEINLTDYTFKIPKINSTKGKVIVPIRIISFVDCNLYDFNLSTIGHTNVVVYTKDTNTLELFEPHGIKYSGYNPLDLDINGMIHYLMCKIFDTKKTIFKITGGMQYKQNQEYPKAGHCSAWSLLFIHFKLLDKDITELNNWSSKELNVYIRKYLTNVLKNNQFVNRNKENYTIEKISVNNIIITNHIKHLFDTFYNQIKLYTVTNIHSEFIRLNKCKNLVFFELKSFELHFPELFQTVCLNYNHPYNYLSKDFF